jgi:hypothetical protein
LEAADAWCYNKPVLYQEDLQFPSLSASFVLHASIKSNETSDALFGMCDDCMVSSNEVKRWQSTEPPAGSRRLFRCSHACWHCWHVTTLITYGESLSLERCVCLAVAAVVAMKRENITTAFEWIRSS